VFRGSENRKGKDDLDCANEKNGITEILLGRRGLGFHEEGGLRLATEKFFYGGNGGNQLTIWKLSGSRDERNKGLDGGISCNVEAELKRTMSSRGGVEDGYIRACRKRRNPFIQIES